MPQPRQYDEGPCWRKRTGLEKLLFGGVIVLAILAGVFFFFFATGKCEVEECNTKSCVKAAAELLEFVDLKADPCHNFYKFACGSFFKNAVKKDTPSPWTSTRTLFENEMKAIVVDPIGEHNSNAHILMKKFYHECMNTTKIEEDGDETFMEAIDELGGWPLINGTHWDGADFNWADWFLKAKRLGLPVIGFFDFDKYDSGILRVRGPHLDMEHYYSSSNFRKLMKGISEAFGAPVKTKDYNSIHRMLMALYSHRFEVDSLYDDDDDDEIDEEEEDDNGDDTDDGDDEEEKETMVNSTTIANLTDVCPNVPWLKILNGLSGNSSQFDNSSKVFFHEEYLRRYCGKLDDLLNETKPEVIVNFFIWSIIHNAHKYMTRDLRGIYEDIDDEDDDRFTVCYKAVDERFEYVKETVYIRKKTFPRVKKDLMEMIEIIKKLFIGRIRKCEWMDETSKALAVEKAERIENLIGADDELYDIEKFDRYLGLDKFKFTSDNLFKMYQEKLVKEDHRFFSLLDDPEDEWPEFFENVVEVNAFFLPSSNTMVIPAPILTSIFYNYKFPASLNYGAMGSTVGHELMHGFTESSRKYESPNGEVIDWWTNTTKELYDEKIKCIIDEYESIPFKYRLNGTLTLEENIADFVGADVGYEAYKIWVERHGTEKKLAGVPLTPEQIYWVQTATNFCFRKLDDNDIDYEEEDEHGIPAFRVQGPARHSVHFAEAFNCPSGSFMNPPEKCQIL